jgi:VanZ family protein
MLRWKLFRSKWLVLGWFLMMCVLFFLPGSDLPQGHWLDDIHIDKLVHVGLFAVLIFLWLSAFPSTVNYYVLWVLFAALIYGLAVEFIQRTWVPNRSFDLFDVAADFLGAIVGWMVFREVYKKNKPL